MIGGAQDTRATVYRRLASLENAGIPLLEGIHKVVEAGGPGERMLTQVYDRLCDGEDPGSAFRGASTITPFEGRLVQAASKSGSLAEVFQQLAEHYEDRAKTVRYTVFGLLYPFFLFHAAIFIPAIPTLVTDGGGVGAFLQQTVLPLGVIYAVTIGGAVFFRAFRQASPAQADALMLKPPVLGTLIRKRAFVAALRVLRTFYANGVSILEALEGAAAACPNQCVGEQFRRVGDRVGSGQTLAEAFALEDGIPPVVSDMVSTGEKTGELDHMLAKAEHTITESANQTRTFLIGAASVGAFAVVVLLIGYRVLSFWLDYADRLNQAF